MAYIKLADKLCFTVQKVLGFKYKMWDGVGMVIKDEWFEGSTKKWQVETEKGVLDLSNSQLSSCLITTFDAQTMTAKLQGARFEVKTNGQTGKEIRYFFQRLDAYKEAPKPQQPHYENADDIPV